MKIIGPFFLLFTALAMAGTSNPLYLRGRVPASASVVLDADKLNFKLRSNTNSNRFTVNRRQENGHQVIEIIYH